MKLINIFFIILALAVLNVVYSQTDYCNLKSCSGATHIGCNNKGHFAKICAPNAKKHEMTYELRVLIVGQHNRFRNRHAGGYRGFQPAARMAYMKWDAELAQLARWNVKQCEMKHDECRNTKTFSMAGQNLAMGGASVKHVIKDAIKDSIARWYNEYLDAKPADIVQLKKGRIQKIGHFTAMIQEKSDRVGCAYLTQTKAGREEYYFACNYAYTNLLDAPVYTIGKPASKCKTGPYSTNFKNLCSIKEKYQY